jgi:hypothetical protein
MWNKFAIHNTVWSHLSRVIHPTRDRLTSHTAPPASYTDAYCLLPVVWVNSGVAFYVTVGSAAMSPRWGEGWSVDLPVTIAAAALGCYVIAGGRGGALHSVNTSQYVQCDDVILFWEEYFWSMHSDHVILVRYNPKVLQHHHVSILQLWAFIV